MKPAGGVHIHNEPFYIRILRIISNNETKKMDAGMPGGDAGDSLPERAVC